MHSTAMQILFHFISISYFLLSLYIHINICFSEHQSSMQSTMKLTIFFFVSISPANITLLTAFQLILCYYCLLFLYFALFLVLYPYRCSSFHSCPTHWPSFCITKCMLLKLHFIIVRQILVINLKMNLYYKKLTMTTWRLFPIFYNLFFRSL